MNRITNLFNKKKETILSIYFTAGFPTLSGTAETLLALQEGGIDLVEVGVPFSDPMADGPVIQHSSTIALRNGMKQRLLFEQLKEVKEKIHIPLILMGYLNPIMQYGFENYCKSCVDSGVSGLIIPDLPFADYKTTFKPIADRYDLKVIMLITPETSEERIRLIDEHTSGFIYMVSSAAITGAQKSFNKQKQAYFQKINAMKLKNPRLIGFGISNKATFDSASENSSGAVIGSKFVQLLEEKGSPKEALVALKEALQFS